MPNMNLRQAAAVALIVVTHAPKAFAFSAPQLQVARKAYCQAEREQVQQSYVDTLGDTKSQVESGDAAAMKLMMATQLRAQDRIQTKFNLSDDEVLRMLNEMLKRYPDIGHAQSALEVMNACNDTGD
jgi:hypothetical protein